MKQALVLSKPMIIVGIDPGVNTGIALWDTDTQKFIRITSTQIHIAMAAIKTIYQDSKCFVVIEDARQMRYFARADSSAIKSGAGIREGVGSVKRDAKIWEDALTDWGIPFRMQRPSKGLTKKTAEEFKRITGWTERTNEHGRDAAMLVFGLGRVAVERMMLDR